MISPAIERANRLRILVCGRSKEQTNGTMMTPHPMLDAYLCASLLSLLIWNLILPPSED